MAEIIRDTIDFSAYMRATDPAVKVRRASQFTEDLVREFAPKDPMVKVPEMFSTKMRGRIKFSPGDVTCWSGYNGHRKSMFTGQVALDLVAAGFRTMLASFEMMPAKTLARMARQANACSRPATASLESFAKWTDGRLWMFDHMGRIDPQSCIAVCRYFAQELKGQHVFIDSMMMVCASEESMDEQKQFMTDCVRLAQETGLHVHVITHCRKPSQGEHIPPGRYDVRGSAAISDQAANIITVWANKEKSSRLQQNPADDAALAMPDARIGIEKQRHDPFEGALKMWFDPESLRFCDDRSSRVEPYVMGAK